MKCDCGHTLAQHNTDCGCSGCDKRGHFCEYPCKFPDCDCSDFTEGEE